MLGKKIWCLVNDHKSLISQIYKARYYPNGDFLSSSLGHNPSFTWRNMYNAQPLVREGVLVKSREGS
uniref:Reverse transcriptase zinc-binding domain-containing protein n=1 Tax=Cajanus cajan TaxID=3821 RepID=A0A151TQG0_CAJCA|nr:hypothetical protein KK1_008438 [Cajanus cajan]